MQQVDWDLRTVTTVSRPRDRDASGSTGRWRITGDGTAELRKACRVTPATKFVLTFYITYVKTQKEVYPDFLLCAIIYVLGIRYTTA